MKKTLDNIPIGQVARAPSGNEVLPYRPSRSDSGDITSPPEGSNSALKLVSRKECLETVKLCNLEASRSAVGLDAVRHVGMLSVARRHRIACSLRLRPSKFQSAFRLNFN